MCCCHSRLDKGEVLGTCLFTEALTACLSPPGRSSLFPIDDNLLDDGHGNQGVPGVHGSPNCYPHQNGERIERFSRKVFVGGLPPDIDEGEEDNTSVASSVLSRICPVLHLSAVSFSPLR